MKVCKTLCFTGARESEINKCEYVFKKVNVNMNDDCSHW